MPKKCLKFFGPNFQSFCSIFPPLSHGCVCGIHPRICCLTSIEMPSARVSICRAAATLKSQMWSKCFKMKRRLNTTLSHARRPQQHRSLFHEPFYFFLIASLKNLPQWCMKLFRHSGHKSRIEASAKVHFTVPISITEPGPVLMSLLQQKWKPCKAPQEQSFIHSDPQ